MARRRPGDARGTRDLGSDLRDQFRAGAEYIVRDAGISVLFVGNREQYEKAVSCMGEGSPLKRVVVFDGDVAVDHEKGAMLFDELVGHGRALANDAEVDNRLAAATFDDLATIIYTSGTTGDPKGVMLTHKNFFAMMYATGRYYQRPSRGGHSLCFLPLSHVFERAWSYGVFQYGMVNSYCPDPKLILEYFSEARPMYMTSVPRLWEKIYATIFERLQSASPRKRKLFGWAVETGKRYGTLRASGAGVPAGLALRHFFADRLVLKKLRALVGGRPVSFNVGGAAFSAEINEFFNGVGITLAQGYGLTEAFPISVSSPEVGIKFGACGKIVPLMQCEDFERGRDPGERPGGHERLLQQAGGHGSRVHAGRMVQDRRRRARGRRRVRAHHRAHQGPHHHLRREKHSPPADRDARRRGPVHRADRRDR